MSLISDALKAAQREHSGRKTGSSGQPLLEGFFPYVSTSTNEGRPRATRLVVISLSAVVVLGVVGWFTAPVIKRALTGGARPPVVLPPSHGATAPAQPAVESSPVVDSQPAVAAPTEAQSVAAAPPAEQQKRASRPPKASSAKTREIVLASDPSVTRGDTVIAQPDAVLPSVPGAPGRRVEPTRRNYELEAGALYNSGDLAGARDRFKLAISTAPTASAWTNYGVTLQRLGDLQGAAVAYRTAFGIDADYLPAWLYLGRAYVLMGDIPKATASFNKALQINPGNGDANTELAELESKDKNWTATRRFAADAVHADPSNWRAHWYLAISSDYLLDKEAAVREYEAYLKTIGSAERENAGPVGYARGRIQELRGKP